MALESCNSRIVIKIQIKLWETKPSSNWIHFISYRDTCIGTSSSQLVGQEGKKTDWCKLFHNTFIGGKLDHIARLFVCGLVY